MNTTHDLHWLDVTLVVTLILAALYGARRGLLRQTGQLISYVAAYYLAVGWHPALDSAFRTNLKEVSDQVSRLHTFLLGFFITYLLFFIGSCLIHHIIRSLSKKADSQADTLDLLGLKPLDRLLGATVSMIVFWLLLGGALLGLSSLADEKLKGKLAGSQLKPYLVQGMHAILQAVPERCREDFQEAMRRLEKSGHTLAKELATEGVQQGTDKLRNISEGLDQASQMTRR